MAHELNEVGYRTRRGKEFFSYDCATPAPVTLRLV
ncbi:hypothetical protein [Hymenobacter cellulosivorans]